MGSWRCSPSALLPRFTTPIRGLPAAETARRSREWNTREAVTENASTVPVTATDLRVGDVIKWSDGRYYAVDTLPEPGHYSQEYSEPEMSILVTEMNEDMTPMTNSKKVRHSDAAVLDVVTPRPEN
jgi:hypothetical protein